MSTQEEKVKSEPKRQRALGTEKLVVRIFREKCIDGLVRGLKLKDVLDDFLRVVLTSPDADSSDKKYARTVYQDAIIRVGGTGLPSWADAPEGSDPRFWQDVREDPFACAHANEVPASCPCRSTCYCKGKTCKPPQSNPGELSQADFDAMIAAVSGVEDRTYEDDVELGHDEFGAYTGHQTSNTGNAIVSGPLQRIMSSHFIPKTEHPFVECFTFAGTRYVAVGSVYGVIPSGPSKGKTINVNFTVNPYKRLRDVPDDILLYSQGRMVSCTYEDPQRTGLRKCLYVVKHRPGLKLRFWSRVEDEDQPAGRKFVVLTDDETGWKATDRKNF